MPQWFNVTDFRVGFTACPDFAVHRPSTLDPRLRLGLCILACAYLVFQGVLVCYLGYITAASGNLFSFRLPNRGDIVPSGVFGVCLPSVYHHRFRSPSFVQAT